ncbi:Amidohydrolase [Phycisphaerae bacterium RAS1]|nr:Amidohydrolase [Phycisphaerae bacterium RAS1]
MIIDVHCHYTLTRHVAHDAERFSFEPRATPPGDHDRHGGPALPTDYDSCVSPRALNRLAWRVMRHVMGVTGEPGPQLDEQIAGGYAEHLLAPGPIDRYVLLAFDAYHDDAGRRPPLPIRDSDLGSDIYTSNTLIRDLCRRRPSKFLLGASIHPYRENAVACIDEVFAAGACLVKWLPLHQNINIRDSRTLAVLRRCAELHLPLLVHYSEEFTLTTQHREHQPVEPLLDVLRRLRREGRMPPVIVAHVATPALPFGETASHEALLDALQNEFAEAPLYADISALAVWSKHRFLRRLARMQHLHHKLVFGTDFPVPPWTAALRRDLGRSYAAVKSEKSWAQRTALAMRGMGFNEIVFQQAPRILANVRNHGIASRQIV